MVAYTFVSCQAFECDGRAVERRPHTFEWHVMQCNASCVGIMESHAASAARRRPLSSASQQHHSIITAASHPGFVLFSSSAPRRCAVVCCAPPPEVLVRSASRIGYTDFGVNAIRLNFLAVLIMCDIM